MKKHKPPKILTTSNNGRIGMVREADLKIAIREYTKKWGCPPDSKSTVVVRNTMIFSDILDYRITEWITGNFEQYHELWTRCQLIQCGGFILPFSSEIWSIDQQKKIFNPISIAKAYELLFGENSHPNKQPA